MCACSAAVPPCRQRSSLPPHLPARAADPSPPAQPHLQLANKLIQNSQALVNSKGCAISLLQTLVDLQPTGAASGAELVLRDMCCAMAANLRGGWRGRGLCCVLLAGRQGSAVGSAACRHTRTSQPHPLPALRLALQAASRSWRRASAARRGSG